MKKFFFEFLFFVALVGAAPNVATAADKIRISVTNFNMSFLSSGLAIRRGFFKEEGLEAEVTMIFGLVVRAAIRGLSVRVVASLIDGSNPSQPGKLAQTMLPI